MDKIKREILESAHNGTLYEYIAEHYYELSKETLKDIVLELAGTVSDNTGADDYCSYLRKVEENLSERWED